MPVFGLQTKTRVICCAARFKFLDNMSDIAFPEERDECHHVFGYVSIWPQHAISREETDDNALR
jgi:hypothetical protein